MCILILGSGIVSILIPLPDLKISSTHLNLIQYVKETGVRVQLRLPVFLLVNARRQEGQRELPLLGAGKEVDMAANLPMRQQQNQLLDMLVPLPSF
jgi:hypothetical protein